MWEKYEGRGEKRYVVESTKKSSLWDERPTQWRGQEDGDPHN
jgi:hypothetical protein